ncbi:hypothetical protein HOD96_03380 [Candidatus Falkowbacteria bacterium]|nr:hypothetical protein [Candidatus Falkowbacteria bacterium]MBT4432970.1 hypothetical protein [Candidatus Falkowbacteria bacterium]
MFQGDWKCGDCGAEIKELPFEPDGSRPIFCRECHRAKRDNFSPRQMFEGNWKCSECGTGITQLPFQPNDESTLLCRDCHRAKQGR